MVKEGKRVTAFVVIVGLHLFPYAGREGLGGNTVNQYKKERKRYPGGAKNNLIFYFHKQK